MSSTSSHTAVLLFAFANDDGRSLRKLDIEQKEIRQLFKAAEKEGKCKIEVLAGATAADIIQAFQEYRNQIRIFHYAGHSNADEIFFAAPYEKEVSVKASNLADFLALQKGLELVFLNSCLSLPQAALYHQSGVKTVLATNTKIGDTDAVDFAKLFYHGLIHAADIQQAYQEAVAGMLMKTTTAYRGIGEKTEKEEDGYPWQLSPPTAVNYWRLPLFAKQLTRIPAINLQTDIIGRAEALEQLRDKLEASSNGVLLNGLGGIGKTLLATAYLQQYGHEYDHLVWINRGENLLSSVAFNEILTENLGILYEAEEDLESRFKKIFRQLQLLPGRNLIVIDNVQEQITQSAIREALPGPPHWKLLMTSRLHLPGFDLLSLGTIDPEDAKTLFKNYCKSDFTTPELEALLKEIGYHTLSIELLARLLDKLNNVLSLAELTTMLKERQLNDPDLQDLIWSRHAGEEQGILFHLLKAFELSKLTALEKWLLQQFIVLPVEPYSVPLLADFLKEKPLSLNKTLNALASKGWLNLHEDKTFSIHRLIRQAAIYQLQPTLSDVIVLIETIIQKTQGNELRNSITQNVPWLPYALAIEDYFEAEKNEATAVIQNNIAGIFHAMGQYAQALVFLQKTADTYEAIYDPSHYLTALTYHNLAEVYRSIGQYEQALECNQKALAIREAALDANHPVLAQSYNNRAEICRAMGHFEEALQWHQKALAIKEATLAPLDPHLAVSYNNLAQTYDALGNYDLALAFTQKALGIFEAVLEPQHPVLGTCYNNMATIAHAMQQYEVSLKWHKKALAIRETLWADNHPDLGQSYNNIGEALRLLEQYDLSLEWHQKARHVWELVFPPMHPNIAISYHNIGEVYRGQEHYEQALAWHQKALAIRTAVLEPTHPDVAQSYLNMASVYYGLYDYEQALELSQKAISLFEAVLAPNHHDLVVAYNNIAEIYEVLEQPAMASQFREKAEAIGGN